MTRCGRSTAPPPPHAKKVKIMYLCTQATRGCGGGVLVRKSRQLFFKKKNTFGPTCFFFFQFSVFGSSKNKKQKKRRKFREAFFPPFKKTHTQLKREASVWSRVYVRGRAGVWGCGRGGVLVPCAGNVFDFF